MSTIDSSDIGRPSHHQDEIMTTIVPASISDTPTARVADVPSHRMHWNWFGLWALLTAFAVFEVVKHGYVNGSALDAAALTTVAVAFFVAPDLTFLVGAGQPVAKGHLAPRAVPFRTAGYGLRNHDGSRN